MLFYGLSLSPSTLQSLRCALRAAKDAVGQWRGEAFGQIARDPPDHLRRPCPQLIQDRVDRLARRRHHTVSRPPSHPVPSPDVVHLSMRMLAAHRHGQFDLERRDLIGTWAMRQVPTRTPFIHRPKVWV